MRLGSGMSEASRPLPSYLNGLSRSGGLTLIAGSHVASSSRASIRTVPRLGTRRPLANVPAYHDWACRMGWYTFFVTCVPYDVTYIIVSLLSFFQS